MTGPGQDGWTWDVAPISAPRLPTIPGHDLLEQLGAGGMGRVYRALDGAGRTVAVKAIPRAELTERSLARFVREGELLARLRHPGVVTVHAWGQTAEHCYMVCELVEGQHIDDAARARDLEGRLGLVDQAARAVAALHELGLVHRDLKPENVLVDGDGRVRVIDLGVSAGEGLERLTQTGQFVGTPLYAPPERLATGPGADAPTGDVWALGAIAYEVVTGEHPYPVASVADLAARGDAPPPSPRRRRPDLPRAVAAELVKALSPDPARRHADAAAFAAALEQARRGGRVPGPVVTACAAALVAALAAGGWSLRPRAAAPEAPRVVVAPVATTAVSVEPAVRLPPDVQALRAVCVGLAGDGRWPELHAVLADRRALPPELRLLRGLAALFTGAETSPIDLAHGDPVHELERRRIALVDEVVAANAARAQRALAEALELVREAREVAPEHPGRRELGRRLSTVVRDMMIFCGALTLIASLDMDRALTLLDEAARLDGADADGLEVAAAWSEFGRAVMRPDVPVRPVLVGPASEVPAPGPWLDTLPPQVAAIAVGLHLASGRASALPEARHVDALDTLRTVGTPGAYLRRLALRALGDLEQDAAVLAFRQGEVERGHALVARAIADLREAIEDTKAAPRPLRWVTLLLMAGDLESARTIVELMGPGHQRRLLQAECDLIEGNLNAAARKAAATQQGRFEGWARRLELHARVLAGELSADEALEQVAPTGEANEEQQGLPWHTEEGLRHVLQGGWWPGRGARGR